MVNHRSSWKPSTIAILATTLALLSPLCLASRGKPATSADIDNATQSFLNTFWNASAGQFYENSDHQTHSHGGQYEDFWWAANTFEAVLDMYQRTGSSQSRALIDAVFDGFFAANSNWQSNSFNDDIGWWALASARAYELTDDAKFLTQSKAMFDFIYSSSYSSDFGGGIWWNRSNYQEQKNVATNAPAVMTAIKLSNALHDSSYLSKAQDLYSWVRSTFYDPNTGHIGDNISIQNGQPVIRYWDFTYNYGTFLGAALAMYQKTGTASYLTDATKAADWAVNYLTLNGTLLYEGEDDGTLFKIIFARNLNHLRVQANQTQYTQFLQNNATQAYNHLRSDGLIGPDWTVTSDASYIQVGAATAGIDMLQLAPCQDITGIYVGNGVYEAENATRHNINTESNYSGYSGRGYLAGWNSDGQWVDFHVNVATSGTYKITLRYAAGAGDATRYIYVNGTGVIDNQLLPGTGSWSNYQTITISGLQLNAGTNTISVIYNSSLGNSNYLNLDNLVLSQ